jgi:hypothetical protein
MARITAQDVQTWTTILTAVQPVIGMGVQGVIALFRLFRRTQGQPENQPGDELLAAEVLASIEKAKKPWLTIEDVASEQLKSNLKKGL